MNFNEKPLPNHKNIIHFTSPPRTNPLCLKSKAKLSCAPHPLSPAFAAEQGFLFCMTFCRRCGAQLASHRNVMQLLTVKARSVTCYSSSSHQYLGQLLQDLLIRVSWRLCVRHELWYEACKIPRRGKKERKRGRGGGGELGGVGGRWWSSCVVRDAFEQNTGRVNHSQKVRGTLKATATESHFVANNDLDAAWTLVPHCQKARVFLATCPKYVAFLAVVVGVHFPPEPS